MYREEWAPMGIRFFLFGKNSWTESFFIWKFKFREMGWRGIGIGVQLPTFYNKGSAYSHLGILCSYYFVHLM